MRIPSGWKSLWRIWFVVAQPVGVFKVWLVLYLSLRKTYPYLCDLNAIISAEVSKVKIMITWDVCNVTGASLACSTSSSNQTTYYSKNMRWNITKLCGYWPQSSKEVDSTLSYRWISVDKCTETHIVDLELALVLLLQMSWQVIEHSSAAAPVGVKAWRASYLMHLQTRLLICGGDGNMLSHNQIHNTGLEFKPRSFFAPVYWLIHRLLWTWG